MSTQTISTAPHPVIAPEVLTFAREQGVEQYLAPLIELARRVYAGATRFEVFTEDDPEIANDRHVVFELDVPLTLEQAMEANKLWHDGHLQIEPYPRSCVFRLGVNVPDGLS